MKKYKNLFDKIVDIDNIILAHNRARKCKTSRYAVAKVDADYMNKCLLILKMLIDFTYKTSPYTTFKVYEPKERLIFRLPYFPDRIIHHAIMNVLEPIWVNLMVPWTYSCIKGRGIHKVLRLILHDLKDVENTLYCLKLDIKKFYPSIDHEILKNIVRIKIADKRVLRLLDEIIDSAEGVPIGNYLSLFFANLYLAYFDRWVKYDKNIKYYYRYADDAVILHKDKAFLHSLLKEIKEYLLIELKLEIKDNYQIFPVESRSINFVGYNIRHNYTRIRKSIKKKYANKAAKLNRIKTSIKYYKRKMMSYAGWFGHANCYTLFNNTTKYKELKEYFTYRKGNNVIEENE